MKKQILFLLLIYLPLSASAFDAQIDGIYYNLEEDHAIVTYMSFKRIMDATPPYILYISNYHGALVIPPSIYYNLKRYRVTGIGDHAFSGCSSLSSVTIPNSVTKIGSFAFYGCGGLTTVTIPKSVTEIGDYVFGGCNLSDVKVEEGNTHYDSRDNCNAIIETSSNTLKVGCKNTAIPGSVTSIGRAAFYGCSELSSIIIPKDVIYLDWGAFSNCSSLTDVHCFAEKVPITETNAFSNVPLTLATLHVPAASIEIYKTTAPWSNFGNIIPIMSHSLTYILDGEVYKTYEVEYNSPITPETAPIKEGHTFSGWSEIPESMPDHDVIVTGSFTINKYKLTFIIDGEKKKVLEVEYGANITPEAAPSKEGYTFSTWSEIPATMPAHDVTITGIFTINKYQLTYMVDDEEYKSYEIEYGSSIIPEEAPTKEGYTFSGWNEIPATMPAENLTVTGMFTINKYKLTYMVDGGEYGNYDIEYGSEVTPETAPTKEGYTFTGWSEIPSIMPAHDVVVNGTFTINKYNLIYKVDGEIYKIIEIEYDSTIAQETAPAKEGYTFSGWSWIPSKMPAEDVTVTGSFTINKYKLTYIIDNEEYNSFELDFGTSITLEPSPTKEGYTFSGWSEIPSTMPDHDVTIIGSFTINKYKLIYKVDGEVYKSYEIEYGSTITPETAPTKEGYTFSGWSEIPGTMPAQDVIVMGTFTKGAYAITYKVDGEVYKTIRYDYGANITPEAAPTKEGYTFSGWSWIPTKMPAEDVTVTGTFTINKYKLTYMIGDEVYKEVTVEYGATITEEPKPEGDYQTFEWVDLPETMPAHDVVVRASFTTDIDAMMATQRNMRIYSPDGKQLNTLQRGLNIIVYDDGTVHKIFK